MAGIGESIKARRMRELFTKKFNADYARTTSIGDIDRDIQYLRNTMYRNKKAFERKGLGQETGKHFDKVLRTLRSSKSMTKQQKAEILDAAVKYSREHKLTSTLFKIQKGYINQALEDGGYSSVIRQAKEMSGNEAFPKLSDADIYKLSEALRELRKDYKEELKDNGSGDEFDAATEVVYAMSKEDRKTSSGYEYDPSKGLVDNIIEYIRQSGKMVEGKVFV